MKNNHNEKLPFRTILLKKWIDHTLEQEREPGILLRFFLRYNRNARLYLDKLKQVDQNLYRDRDDYLHIPFSSLAVRNVPRKYYRNPIPIIATVVILLILALTPFLWYDISNRCGKKTVRELGLTENNLSSPEPILVLSDKDSLENMNYVLKITEEQENSETELSLFFIAPEVLAFFYAQDLWKKQGAVESDSEHSSVMEQRKFNRMSMIDSVVQSNPIIAYIVEP